MMISDKSVNISQFKNAEQLGEQGCVTKIVSL